MRHAAWHEGAGARPTDRELVAEIEGDFAAQHVGHLVTVVVKVDVVSEPAGPVSSNTTTLLPVSSPTAQPPALIYKPHVRIPGARCGNLQTRERLGRQNADASSNFRWRVAVAIRSPLRRRGPSPMAATITWASTSHRRRFPSLPRPAEAIAAGRRDWPGLGQTLRASNTGLLERVVVSIRAVRLTKDTDYPSALCIRYTSRAYIFPAQNLKGHRKKIIGLISQITVMKCIDVSLEET